MTGEAPLGVVPGFNCCFFLFVFFSWVLFCLIDKWSSKWCFWEHLAAGENVSVHRAGPGGVGKELRDCVVPDSTLILSR